VSGLGLAGSVVVEPAGARSVFVPRKFQARAVAKVGGDLWGYLAGGREQADYYLGADGTRCEAVAEPHGRCGSGSALPGWTGWRLGGWPPAATP
jgi:hypothetical protein